jgi:hypothetical protein
MAGDQRRFEMCRDPAGETAQGKWLSNIVDLQFADSWRNLARPITLFDKHSPRDSLWRRNRRIL